MDLTLHLERDGAFAGRPPIRRFTLDALCDMFGVIPHDRHTASGDAFITAQVFLRLLKLAAATAGRRSPASANRSSRVPHPERPIPNSQPLLGSWELGVGSWSWEL